MIERNTVFILGAGAGKDVGMPLGDDLKQQVAELLDFGFGTTAEEAVVDRNDIVYERRVFDSAVHRVLVENRQDSNRHRQCDEAMKAIVKHMPAALSIDNFIHNYAGNEFIRVCAKLGIAICIMRGERKSALRKHFGDKPDAKSTAKVGTSWHNVLWRILSTGHQLSNIGNTFENTAFINFNYDRCLEFYLHNRLDGLSFGSDSKTIRPDLPPILHPYGTVGEAASDLKSIDQSFGAQLLADGLISAAERIQTFTEDSEVTNDVKAMRHLIHRAETVILLGFGFHQQNLDLISPNMKCNASQIFATTLKVPATRVSGIKTQLATFLGRESGGLNPQFHGTDCAALLTEIEASIQTFGTRPQARR